MASSQLIRKAYSDNPFKFKKVIRKKHIVLPDYKEKDVIAEHNKAVFIHSVKMLKKLKDQGTITDEQYAAVLILFVSKFIETLAYGKINNALNKMLV